MEFKFQQYIIKVTSNSFKIGPTADHLSINDLDDDKLKKNQIDEYELIFHRQVRLTVVDPTTIGYKKSVVLNFRGSNYWNGDAYSLRASLRLLRGSLFQELKSMSVEFQNLLRNIKNYIKKELVPTKPILIGLLNKKISTRHRTKIRNAERKICNLLQTEAGQSITKERLLELFDLALTRSVIEH
jgi:hypothetical protein